MTDSTPKYFGIYLGTVANNQDPMHQGRIQAFVTDVCGDTPTTYAKPCAAMAGPQAGIYTVPPMGAGVWVMFENGDPDRPVWIGGWWGSAAEVPAVAQSGNPLSPSIVLQTVGQNMIEISDVPGAAGGIVLRSGTSMIMVNQTGITITNGLATIRLMGQMVDINNGALTVT